MRRKSVRGSEEARERSEVKGSEGVRERSEEVEVRKRESVRRSEEQGV